MATHPSPFAYPGILRAARGILNWSQRRLAKEAGLAHITIAGLERGSRSPSIATIQKVEAALTEAGIIFLANETGVAIMVDWEKLEG